MIKRSQPPPYLFLDPHTLGPPRLGLVSISSSAHAKVGSTGHISKGPDGLSGYICPECVPLAGDDKSGPQKKGL